MIPRNPVADGTASDSADSELVRKIQNGNREALETLVRRHQDWINIVLLIDFPQPAQPKVTSVFSAYVRRDVVRDSAELFTRKRHLSTERTPSLRRLNVPKHGTIRSVENAANSDLSDERGHPLQRFFPTAEDQRKLRHIEVQIRGGSMLG
jgi:hypothetical protein